MNKREAKILALEMFAESVSMMLEQHKVLDAIRTTKDFDLVNEVFYEFSAKFQMRAGKLKSNKKNK
jgi:hypothetical protein